MTFVPDVLQMWRYYLETFISDVLQILRYYLEWGLPFLVLHLVVFLTLRQLWREHLYPDAVQLRNWPDVTDQSRPCVRILQRYLEDCQALGSHGFLPSASELSESLRHQIDSNVDMLHSRVNLFLVVGVAGTFFAMFQFLLKVQSGEVDVLDALKQGLMQGFPIGFFGLVWTLLGHYRASQVERDIRSAADSAIEKVLKERPQHLRSVVSEVTKALEPLRKLEDTLAKSLTPVIEEFGKQLAAVAKLLSQEIKPLVEVTRELQQSTGDLSAAVEELARATAALPANLERLSTLVMQSEAAVRNLAECGKTLESAVLSAAGELHGGAEALHGAASELQYAAQELRFTPDFLRRQLAEDLQAIAELLKKFFEDTVRMVQRATDELMAALANIREELTGLAQKSLEQQKELADQVAAEWRDALEKIHRATLQRLEAVWTSLEEHVKSASQQLEQAAGHLATTSAQIDAILNKSIQESYRQLVEFAQPDLDRIRQAIVAHYPRLLENLERAAKSTEVIVGSLDKVEGALQEAAEALEKASRQLADIRPGDGAPGREQILSRLAEILSRLADIRSAVEDSARQIRALRKALPLAVVQDTWGRLIGLITNRKVAAK